MLPTFLTSTRIEYELRRTIRALEERIELQRSLLGKQKQIIAHLQRQVGKHRNRADLARSQSERLRAELAESEAYWLRRQMIWETRLQRLEEALGLTSEFEDENNHPPENSPPYDHNRSRH